MSPGNLVTLEDAARLLEFNCKNLRCSPESKDYDGGLPGLLRH